MSCLNCNSEILSTSKYCPQCGQKQKINLNPHFSDLLHELMHEIFHVDGKIFSTLKVLLIRPGLLTKDFFEGKRSKYITPIRLYLTISFIYFVLSTALSVKVTNPEPMDISVADTSQIKIELDNRYKKEIEKFIYQSLEGLKKIKNDQSEFSKLFNKNLASSLFFLMPVFALLLKIIYFRNRKNYPQFLYFSLHYHSAMLLGLLINWPLSWLGGGQNLWLLWSLGYLFLSLKRVWSDTNKSAVKKTIFMFFTYGSLVGIACLIAASYSLYLLGKK